MLFSAPSGEEVCKLLIILVGKQIDVHSAAHYTVIVTSVKCGSDIHFEKADMHLCDGIRTGTFSSQFPL